MHKIHLDTDLGGDIDDLCALAMLLCWEDVDFTGITTVAEANGRRAGYVRYILELAGRQDIPVAAGADVSRGFYRYAELGYPDEMRYWGKIVPPSPNPVYDALRLLKRSIEEDATIIAIGPFTNLYLLDLQYPGILVQARLFLMGGFVHSVRPGYPNWGNDSDWNIQVDVKSARHVIENSNPTLIPLSVTVEAALRRSHLPALKGAGALDMLIARQAEEFAVDEGYEKKFGETCEELPDDMINFLHDPLACAIALGWNDGIEIEEVPLVLEEKDGWLHERIAPAGRPTHIVTRINGTRFSKFWLSKITNR
jgi:purine nucleosidase